MDAARTAPLERFLNPASIAIIGASPEPHKIRGALLYLLIKNGYGGRIYPVNPSYEAISDLRCYPTIASVNAPVDLALVAIPASGVLAALEECAAAGVANAIVISSGFAEDEAAPPGMQHAIRALARRTGMRISGPNAEGFHNEISRVTATFSPALDRDAGYTQLIAARRRIGVVAQSGGIGFSFYNRGTALGLSFSIVATMGNESDLSAADFFAHMARDEDTAAILLFLEAVRDPAGFMAAAEAAWKASKPVVALKVGRSAVGKQATMSHTASMAGWDTAYDAAFCRFGITLATEIDEALSLLSAFVTCPPAKGGRTAIVTVSGGGGAWAADCLSAAGLDLPVLSTATQTEIGKFIPSYGTACNPIDLTAQGASGGGMLRTIELLSEDEDVDIIAVVTSLANPTRVSIDPDGLGKIIATRKKPVMVYSYTLPSELARQAMAKAGVVIHPSMSLLSRSARALVDRARMDPPALIAPLVLDAPVRQRLAVPGALAEHEAKSLLAAAGIAVSPSRLVKDAGALAEAAADLCFPLAAKIQSAEIPHKTEAGGVRLGIADLAGLQAAFQEVIGNARRHAPDARIDGVLLERMAPRGVEMIIGIVRDPTFGPVVMVGAGGVATELYRDTAHRLAPVDEAGALAMIDELKSAPLLKGFRGAPPADLPALARLIARTSQLAAAGKAGIAELELNPVIVHPMGQGFTIADALLVVRPAET